MSEYVPFGDEWKKHVAKLPKRELIDMLSEALRGKQEAQLELLREQRSRPTQLAQDAAVVPAKCTAETLCSVHGVFHTAPRL